MLGALWRHRLFISASIFAELRGRFAGSKLGLAWSILHPLAQAAIFTIVLAEILGARIPGIEDRVAYPIYLMAGLAGWGVFSETLNRSATMFLDYATPLKKVAIPRVCLPAIILGGALINHTLLLGAVLVIMLVLGRWPSEAILWIPLGVVLASAMATGIGIIVGTMNVFARDIGQALPIIMQLWFWLTPIVYTPDLVPAHLRWLVQINPLSSVVGVYQNALLYQQPVDLGLLVTPAVLTASLLAASTWLFRRASADLVDAL